MSIVILPDNTDDGIAYNDVRDLAHIASTNAEIDVSPPFRLAERHAVIAVPQLRLPGGRNLPEGERADLLLALASLAAVYFIRAGGRTASGTSDTQTTTTGELKSTSMTIEGLTLRRDFQSGTTTSDVRTNRQSQVPYQDQVDFLLQQAKEIFEQYGGSTSHLDPDPITDIDVGLTRSRIDCPPIGGSSQDGQQGTGELLPVEGELTYVEEDM